MKATLITIAVGSLFATIAIAQPSASYTVTDLGTLPGGNFSQAISVNASGVVSGIAGLPDGTQHAVLWQAGHIMDIGTPGYGGPNSGAYGVNAQGQAEVQAETSAQDPNHENFCAYGTGLRCQPFLFQNGVLNPLPTLGGFNGIAGGINNLGQIAGIAETGIQDPECTTGVTFSGTGPQVLDFEAVVWGPGLGQVRKLNPLPGDTVGMALSINDNGQAVGASGSCANTILPPLAGGPHAVLWDKDGSVTNLGNLGGTIDITVTGSGNVGLSINSIGQVTGGSDLKGDTAFHAFLWNRATGMMDLGTLPGDVSSVGLAIDDIGNVVGSSFDQDFNPRPFLWRKGVMTDLNSLIPSGFPLYLLFAESINSKGQIAGFGATEAGDVHGFLASPVPVTTASANPKNATIIVRQTTLDGTGSISADGKPLTYLWSIPQGHGYPSAAILQGNTATPTVQFDQAHVVYTFQLTVTDSSGNSASDLATVNFQGN